MAELHGLTAMNLLHDSVVPSPSLGKHSPAREKTKIRRRSPALTSGTDVRHGVGKKLVYFKCDLPDLSRMWTYCCSRCIPTCRIKHQVATSSTPLTCTTFLGPVRGRGSGGAGRAGVHGTPTYTPPPPVGDAAWQRQRVATAQGSNPNPNPTPPLPVSNEQYCP